MSSPGRSGDQALKDADGAAAPQVRFFRFISSKGALTESDVPPCIKQEDLTKTEYRIPNPSGEEEKKRNSSQSDIDEEKGDSSLMVISIIVAALVAFAAVEYAGGQTEPRAAFDDVPSGTEAGVPLQGVVCASSFFTRDDRAELVHI